MLAAHVDHNLICGIRRCGFGGPDRLEPLSDGVRQQIILTVAQAFPQPATDAPRKFLIY
jgi:hypothetical protein